MLVCITRVILRPRIHFGGDKHPTKEEVRHMNESAHEACFIANSVKCEVTIEASLSDPNQPV